MTYLLLALNVFVFGVTYSSYTRSDQALDEFFDDDSFIQTQGSAFAVMIMREPQIFSETLRVLAKSAVAQEKNARELLGGFAMRNTAFMARAQTYAFGGDEIAIEHWRKRLKQFMAIQNQNPSYRFGVSQVHNEWINWFTYQFAHAGFQHLFWNMVFLLVFGCFVELRFGSSFVAVGYIVGGVVGAATYAGLSGISYSPLVGASGAISALIGLVTVACAGRERLSFLYVLIPVRGYMGLALLPSWLLALVYLLPDLSHYVASSREVGSVAYSAHMGGAFFGALVALILRMGLIPVKKAVVKPAALEPEEDHAKAA